MSVFFAFMNRLKYINRWNLMRNTHGENVMEHTAIVSMFAHALAVLHTKLTGEQVNAERTGMLALYHEAGEVITGDMPTPVKYFNREITEAYKAIEKQSGQRLSATLPGGLKDEISDLIEGGSELERTLVKHADKLAAYVKCLEELSQGNKEFAEAETTIRETLKSCNSKAVDFFMANFVEEYGRSLDQLSRELN